MLSHKTSGFQTVSQDASSTLTPQGILKAFQDFDPCFELSFLSIGT